MLFWIDKILKAFAAAIWLIPFILFANVGKWTKILVSVIFVIGLLFFSSRENIEHNVIYRSKRNFTIFIAAFIVFAVCMTVGVVFREQLVALIGVGGFMIVWYALMDKKFLKFSKKQ
jgi:hypothetical protein